MHVNNLVKEQSIYSNVPAWHKAGLTGRGVNIWNAEGYTKQHGAMTHQRVLDAAPDANLITTSYGLSYTSSEIRRNVVTYNGVTTSIEDFIKNHNIKIITVSKTGSNAIGKALSRFWGDLQKKYNLIIFCCIGNEAEEEWGGAIPYDVAIYVGAASLLNGKPCRDYYSSVGPELDFMQFTGGFGGTSFATPYLAGMAALLVQAKPDITQEEVYKYFKDHAEDMQGMGHDDYTGHGLAKLGSIDEDWEGNEMITKTKIKVNGQIKEVNRILKNGENYIRLRDFEDVLGVVNVDYDPKEKLPIVED